MPTSTKANGSPHYTLPVIHDHSTDAVVSDSAAIAEYLDATYPSTPALFPRGTLALQHAFSKAHADTLDGLWEIILPASNAKLNPPSQEYFRRTREAFFGAKLEELSPPGPTREKHWAQVKRGFDVVNGWLEKNEQGKTFVMGDTISYADIVIVSFLIWMKRVLEVKEWKDIESWHGGRWDALLNSFAKYETVVV